MSTPAPFVVHQPILVSPSALNPTAFNPRKISPEKYEGLKRSILVDGFVEPVVVQKKGLRIIGGHQRVRAVKEISVEAGVAPPDIPATVLDVDDVAAKKLNLKLNRLRGEFEARMLGELLIDIYDNAPTARGLDDDERIDLGFDDGELARYVDLIEAPLPPEDEPDEPKAFGRSITLSLEFSTVEARDRVKKILTDRAELVGKKSGDVVAAALSAPAKARRPAKGGAKARA